MTDAVTEAYIKRNHINEIEGRISDAKFALADIEAECWRYFNAYATSFETGSAQ